MHPAFPAADDAYLRSLHPDCPDWQELGAPASQAALRVAAESQRIATEQRDQLWSRGFNRRTFLKGGLGVGVALLGTQLVTTRVSYAADGASTGTLVVIFLRGGMDGLSLLVPTSGDDRARLQALRPSILVPADSVIPLDTGFGLHPAMAPLRALVTAGKVAAIPAVSTPDLSRSHFQAQDLLERGATSSQQTGWLDRALEQSGPGTTFRSVAVGGLLPRSLMGSSGSLSMDTIDDLELSVADDQVTPTTRALERLYTGLDHPISTQSLLALDALATAARIRADRDAAKSTVTYPDGNLGEALASVAAIIKGQVGVRVATIDVGGWDMHTLMGTVDEGQMTTHLGDLATALAAFAADLGGALDSTTILTMSEFGRRIEQNANTGTDHGHGGVVLAMGAGVVGGVHGRWLGLADDVLDAGDVPGANDYRDVLAEVVGHRLDLGSGGLAKVFPGWQPTSLGVMS